VQVGALFKWENISLELVCMLSRMLLGCWTGLLLHPPLLKRNKSEAVTSVQYIVNSIH